MTPDQIETYVDAACAALQLPLAPGHRPGVLSYFALAAGFADLLNAVPLEPHDEAAMRFVPVEPPVSDVTDADMQAQPR